MYYAVIAAILFGLAYTSSGQAVKFIDTKTYLLFSCLVSSALFLIYGLIDSTVVKDITSDKTKLPVLWLAFGSLASFFACHYSVIAIKSIGASKASILEISYPLWVVLFTSMIENKNTVTLQTVLGGLIIFLGTYVVLKSHS